MKRKNRSRIVKIYCATCKTLLYKYRKEGGDHLVKCYKDMILEDYTNKDLKCPKCHNIFAREAFIHCRKANKIIQGHVIVQD